MLTVAYCRVSTEEQATEGFSIEGQAEKLCVDVEFNAPASGTPPLVSSCRRASMSSKSF